jgi:hypothetical protein
MTRPASAILLSMFAALFSAPALTAGVPATGAPDCFNGSNVVSCAETVSPAMSYAKLDIAGNALDAAAPSWACVRDNVTGLIWETKTSDASLRGAAHRYAWFDADTSRNGGQAGGDGSTDSCANTLGGLACTTANYIDAVNAANLCGANDWRLPSQMELLTLIHAGTTQPVIDTTYFPHTASIPYWSASTHAKMPAAAWGAHFGYGASHAETKAAANAVRAVRGSWKP